MDRNLQRLKHRWERLPKHIDLTGGHGRPWGRQSLVPVFLFLWRTNEQGDSRSRMQMLIFPWFQCAGARRRPRIAEASTEWKHLMSNNLRISKLVKLVGWLTLGQEKKILKWSSVSAPDIWQGDRKQINSPQSFHYYSHSSRLLPREREHLEVFQEMPENED